MLLVHKNFLSLDKVLDNGGKLLELLRKHQLCAKEN